MERIQILPLHHPFSAPKDLWLLADPSEEMLDRYLPHSHCFQALAGSITIGVIALLLQSQTEAEIMNIAVSPLHHRKGIAQMLLLHAESFAISIGVHSLTVATGNSSLGPLALYQKVGFEIQHIDHGYFTRHYPDPIWENGMLCTDRIVLRKAVG